MILHIIQELLYIETRNHIPVSYTHLIDFDRLSAAVTAHTKGVFVNSPNNPSGVVYTEENIQKLAAFLETKSAEYGHPIYLIVDEPYRELVYGDVEVPYLTKYYKNKMCIRDRSITAAFSSPSTT